MCLSESVTAAHNKCLNALIDAIIKHKKKKSSIVFIKEFKRTMDLRPNFQAKSEDRAKKQHKWFTETLSRAVAQKGWEVQTVIFTGGTMGSVKIDRFEQNLTTLEVKKKAWATILMMHARALLEAHDTVLRAYYDAVYASHTQVTQHRHHVTSNVYV
jgi:hypothetical protein